LHGKGIDIVIPCNSESCDCNLFIADKIVPVYVECVEVVCLQCKHRQLISLEDYKSITGEDVICRHSGCDRVN
jgi:hypothetical protein